MKNKIIKYLLVFILIMPLLVNGQDSNVYESPGQNPALIITSTTLFEYEIYCYNDSTLTEVYVDPNYTHRTENGLYITTAMGGYMIKKWIHRKPNDLGHFIKWLHNKRDAFLKPTWPTVDTIN